MSTIKYVTTTEIGKLWHLSSCRVGILCAEGRIPDVQKAGKKPSVTIAEMATLAAVSRKTIERAVKRLREAGRIERTGGKRNEKWVVLN